MHMSHSTNSHQYLMVSLGCAQLSVFITFDRNITNYCGLISDFELVFVPPMDDNGMILHYRKKKLFKEWEMTDDSNWVNKINKIEIIETSLYL